VPQRAKHGYARAAPPLVATIHAPPYIRTRGSCPFIVTSVYDMPTIVVLYAAPPHVVIRVVVTQRMTRMPYTARHHRCAACVYRDAEKHAFAQRVCPLNMNGAA